MRIYEGFEQGSDLWLQCRMGMPTTSDFKKVRAKGKGDNESVQRKDLIDQICAELYTGTPKTTWRGGQMVRGHEQEPDAFAAYKLTYPDAEISQPAFIRTEVPFPIGTSPDCLVGEDGGAEFKTLEGGRMWRAMKLDRPPPEHLAQVQGSLMITGRAWWDLCLYCPGYHLLVYRMAPNKAYQNEMMGHLREFWAQVQKECVEVTGVTAQTYRERIDARLDELLMEAAS